VASSVNAAQRVRVLGEVVYVLTRCFHENTCLAQIYWGKPANVRQGPGCLCVTDSPSVVLPSDGPVPGQDQLSWKALPVA